MTQAAAKQEIVTKPGSEISVVDLDINSQKIAMLADRCKNLSPDLKTEESYRETQDVINEAREMRGKIKSAGKALKDDAIAWQKKVVAEEKRLDAEITAFLEPLAAHKKVHDDAVKAEAERKKKLEQMRKDTHLANINGIRLFLNKAQGQPSSKIEEVILELESVDVNEDYEEFQSEAEDVYEDTMLAINALLIKAQTQEEADRQRAEEDARLKKEREALEAQRLENERIQKENDRVAEENRIAAEKLKTPVQATDKTDETVSVAEILSEPAHAPGISDSVKQKIDEDNSVIDQIERNTEEAIFNVINKHASAGTLTQAKELLAAIRSKQIPNVKYDIY